MAGSQRFLSRYLRFLNYSTYRSKVTTLSRDKNLVSWETRLLSHEKCRRQEVITYVWVVLCLLLSIVLLFTLKVIVQSKLFMMPPLANKAFIVKSCREHRLYKLFKSSHYWPLPKATISTLWHYNFLFCNSWTISFLKGALLLGFSGQSLGNRQQTVFRSHMYMYNHSIPELYRNV